MSVYTSVDFAQLEQFLLRYDLGQPSALEPIADGITNTNYRVDTGAGKFVLTLYEHHSDDELDYLLGLQAQLAAGGLRCATPMADRRGDYFSTLNQRPAALIERLQGAVVARPEPAHCAQIAGELARFHQIGQSWPGTRSNPRGLDWMAAARDMLDNRLDADARQLIDATLQAYRASPAQALPGGAIHADLFHDNALFVDDELTGLFDFDYACSDCFLFDLAVLINDWCIDEQGELDPPRLQAVLQGYLRERKPDDAELKMLPLMLQVTALRFWLSRLHDQTFPLSGELTYLKSPDVFRRMLELRRQQASGNAELLSRCAVSNQA